MFCGCNKLRVCKAIIIGIMILVVVIFFFVVCCQNNKQNINILTATAIKGDNPEVGEAIIKFSKNEIVEGTAISHQEDSNEININETGYYQISYQIFGIRKTAGTFNFNALLLVNNLPLENTFNETPILKDSANRMTLTSTVILKLNQGDILQLGAISLEEINYETARIDIEKIG